MEDAIEILKQFDDGTLEVELIRRREQRKLDKLPKPVENPDTDTLRKEVDKVILDSTDVLFSYSHAVYNLGLSAIRTFYGNDGVRQVESND